MTVYSLGSLFSGIGGLELGLEMTGQFKTVWQSEIDPFCQSVLARNFPDSIQLGDIEGIDGNEIKTVDVICGGFPCQDISTAGRQLGLAGARSGLFFRAMDIVREVKPKCVILENVRNILNKGFEHVLRSFSDIGYNVEWQCISASRLGYCHKRERVFIIAYTSGIRQPRPWTLGEPVDPAASDHREAGRFVDAFQRKALPYLCAEHDGVDTDTSVAIMKALGNAVVPDVARVVGNRVLEVLEPGAK